MSDTVETNSRLPEWVKKIKSNFFSNKKQNPENENVQTKSSDIEKKLLDVSDLKEEIARFLTSDNALTLSLSGANNETSGLIRFIVFDGGRGERVGIFATTRFWLDPKADRAVLGSTALTDKVGIKIFDQNSKLAGFISWNKFVSSISSSSREIDEEEFNFPVTGSWEEGTGLLLESQYNLLLKILSSGRLNRKCMDGEVLRMKGQAGDLVKVESSAQNLSLNNLIQELMLNVNPALSIKADG